MPEHTSRRPGKRRRRGINYLKNLGRMIRDLTGFATLTFELVQNADDAKATTLRFDVRDDALVVFNDARFSNCGDQDRAPDECLLLPVEGHKCDFHSFCDVGGADKQERDNTTDFFPGSDRRRLLVEGPRGEWNRLAMTAIARALADGLEIMAGVLGAARLWNILFCAHQAKDHEDGLGFRAYWAQLAPTLPDAPVMWTTALRWTTPSRAYLRASSPGEGTVVPLLERLGVPIVHPEVAGHVRQMSNFAGAHEFTLAVYTGAFAAADAGVQDSLARLFPQAEERLSLWEEAERLLARTKPGPDRDAFRNVSIMPGLNGRLCAAHDLYRADAATVKLVKAIDLPLQFLDTPLCLRRHRTSDRCAMNSICGSCSRCCPATTATENSPRRSQSADCRQPSC